MNYYEKKLFKELCEFKKRGISHDGVCAATPQVLGHLFFNRMQGIAYGKLVNAGLLGRVNREFRNSLRNAWEINKEKNKSYFCCVDYVNKLLFSQCIDYAMLKGAYLCALYPEGYRTSNDIDVLIRPEDVTTAANCLKAAGFVQGNVRNGEFIPASRKEIIESKMTRGETVPFIKEVGLPFLKFIEVDLNFSLDYKTGNDDSVEIMLSNASEQCFKTHSVRTLDRCDFFVHLCGHLYKEATTLPWVEMGRDMTLYKYSDIYMLLDGMNQGETEELFERAKIYGMEKICAFAVLQTKALLSFENEFAVSKAKKILKDDKDFLHTVVAPKEKKELIYSEHSIKKRFFSKKRIGLLQEKNKEM